VSRSGYDDFDSCDNYHLYRGTVERSIQGKRGQAFLKDLASALDAMPNKRLIAGELISETGEVCAIGSVCKARGLDVTKISPEEPEDVGKLVGISRSMAAEIAYENDECEYSNTPEERWVRMREWVRDNLKRDGDGKRG
jgi:hypothetical protein